MSSLASILLAVASTGALAVYSMPLAVTDARQQDGTITVETTEWKLVFDKAFNGGPARLYDLAFDPGEADNLATASGGGFYSQGGIFDYDIYLGTDGANQQEYMTTMGTNSTVGSLQLSILEVTPARVRISQSGHPRLNNGTGPPGDPFPELPLISFTTLWTIYPTGRINIDFVSTVESAGMIVDSGPGNGGAGIDAPGTNVVNAVGGANFQTKSVWAGDTIESSAGGWGPILVTARISPTQLQLASNVPAGSALDFTIRRSNVVNETISIHGDGDPSIVSQCSDPATSHWQGGSDGDPLWDTPIGDPCGTLFNGGQPWLDSVLAHWTRTRGFGSLLAFFEPWSTANYGAYNDLGFTDISYTQLGRAGIRPAEGHDRDFLAQLGSTASSNLPTIKSVADAVPHANDYRQPYAVALVGALASDLTDTHGFDPGIGAYEIQADSGRAEILLDASGGGRSALAYKAPAILISGLSPSVDSLAVALSTDGGSSFSTLAPNLYNLTEKSDEGNIGTGRRLFQYLLEVPGLATGSSAFVFRLSGAGAACDDGIDNDGDGLIDFPADFGCADVADLTETDPALVCDDGIDNDEDTFVDYPSDPGCGTPWNIEDPECDDGEDNDNDTFVDYPSDPGCDAAFRNIEDPQCSDGVDNDGDGFVDYSEDPQCSTESDGNESCGLGVELLLLMAPLLLAARRRGRDHF